jgi:hypothetical protein
MSTILDGYSGRTCELSDVAIWSIAVAELAKGLRSAGPSAFSAAMGSTARLAFESPATFLTPKPVTQPVKVWNQRGPETGLRHSNAFNRGCCHRPTAPSSGCQHPPRVFEGITI